MKRNVYLIKTENGYRCSNPSCNRFTKVIWKSKDSRHWVCKDCYNKKHNNIGLEREQNDN